MATQGGPRGELHAIISEVEPGLFRAEYQGELNPENPDARELPDSHIGTSLEGVKTWVEQMALGMGFSGVVWDTLP